MSKTVVLLLVLVIAIALIVIGYVILRPEKTPEAPVYGEGTLPQLETESLSKAQESAGKLPELNPVEKTNPFKDVYTNPFQ